MEVSPIWFLVFLVTKVHAQYTIEINNSFQLAEYGSNIGCTYFESLSDIDCKDSPPVNSNEGFWSSCHAATCELKIDIGKIGGANSIASKLDLHSFAKDNSHIRVRYQLTATSNPVNLNPIIESNADWVSNEFSLNPLLGWTNESVLLVRMNSAPFTSDVDVVDKISVEFVPLPEEVVDTIQDMGDGWAFNCAYHTNYADLPCPTNVVPSGGNRAGFWSSCGQYCALSYSWTGKPGAPSNITINSFVAGYARVDVWVRVGGILNLVDTVQNTAWTSKLLYLNEFGLDQNSEILIEPFSTRYPHHVDLIDKITIKFSLPA